MKLFQLILSFLILSTCQTAEQSKFYFYFLDAPNEIKNAIGTPDLYKKLENMNVDSDYFEMSKPFLEPEKVEQYIRAQVEISSSLYLQEDLIEFGSLEMKEFASHLLKYFEEHFELFDKTKLLAVFTIFIASGTPKNSTEIRSILAKHVKKLKVLHRLELLRQLVKFASAETIFFAPSMLTEDFASIKRIEVFLNDYIQAAFSKIDPSNYSDCIGLFLMILICASKADQFLSDSSYELLLTGLKGAVDSPWHESILNLLNLFFEKISNQPHLVKLLIDILFKLLAIDSSDSDYHTNIINLMIKCTRADSVYFNSVLDASSDIDSKYFETYSKKLRSFTLALNCFENLRRFNFASTSESYFRLALSSAKNLRQIYKTCPEAIDSISNSYTILKVFTSEQFRVFRDIDFRFNTYSLKIFVYLVLIEYERATGDQKIGSAGKISFGLGLLLLDSLITSENYPTEIVDHVGPLLDEIVENLCLISKTLTMPMTSIELSSYLKVVELHSSPDIIDAATDQLCLALVTSMPIKSKGYLYVKDLDYTDESGIAVTGFLHFVQEHLKDPKISDLNNFKDYFNHLVSKKFLNKSEQLAITRIFGNFK